MMNFYRNWRTRHRHPVSFVLHVLAIPLLPAAGVLVVVQLANDAWALWWRPVGLLAASYLLQWIGHRIEGNDMGEWMVIKRALGLPCTPVSPRFTIEASKPKSSPKEAKA